MKSVSYKWVVLAFLFTWQSSVYSDKIQNARIQLEQLKQLLIQIQKDSLDANQSKVFLGSEQMAIQRSNDMLSLYITNLIPLLNNLEKKSAQHEVSELQWLPDTKGIQSFNAGQPGQKLTICQAPFLGPRSQGKALYPGELTNNGCRITYGGYAFTVNKYYVLTGMSTGLHWISINDVKRMMKAPLNTNNPTPRLFPFGKQQASTFQPSLIPPRVPFNYNVTINGASPIAGGYQGEAPVLICRVKQNENFIIGKSIFFQGSGNQLKDACNIGVDEKEVVIEKDYELLFWKMS